jgi:hypothetical protein
LRSQMQRQLLLQEKKHTCYMGEKKLKSYNSPIVLLPCSCSFSGKCHACSTKPVFVTNNRKRARSAYYRALSNLNNQSFPFSPFGTAEIEVPAASFPFRNSLPARSVYAVGSSLPAAGLITFVTSPKSLSPDTAMVLLSIMASLPRLSQRSIRLRADQEPVFFQPVEHRVQSNPQQMQLQAPGRQRQP